MMQPSTAFSTKAPAKLNLRLKFTGRRADGYHELSMINVPINLHDELRAVFSSESCFELEVHPASRIKPEAIGPAGDNLIMKAAKAFLARYPLPFQPAITLQKNIPAGAGLGGGSSDAAAILRMLAAARAFYLPAERGPELQELADISSSIGADIPFFVYAEPAIVSGIGEHVQSLPSVDAISGECVLFLPDVAAATADMYAAVRSRYPMLSGATDERVLPLLNSPVDRKVFVSLIENDFQPIACEKYPLLGTLFSKLTELRDVTACLTGSGSAVFVLPRGRNAFAPGTRETLCVISRTLGIPIEDVRIEARPPGVFREPEN